MARTVRPRVSSSDSEDDQLWGKPKGPLSRISEGSNESTPSTYFSCASAQTSHAKDGSEARIDHEFLTAVGKLRLGASSSSTEDIPHRHGEPQRLASGVSSARELSQQTSSADLPAKDPESLRQTVKEFVEAGVRGRRLQVLRRDGQTQKVTFRLSRRVDAFEVLPEGGVSGRSVGLGEVSAVRSGNELPGLDCSCAVVELHDSRCLALRFPEASEAQSFTLCMRLFADEVRRTGEC